MSLYVITGDIMKILSAVILILMFLTQLVLNSHRWVPLPAVGFSANSVAEESQEDVTPPSHLMEHPPLAVFVNGGCFLWREIYLKNVHKYS